MSRRPPAIPSGRSGTTPASSGNGAQSPPPGSPNPTGGPQNPVPPSVIRRSTTTALPGIAGTANAQRALRGASADVPGSTAGGGVGGMTSTGGARPAPLRRTSSTSTTLASVSSSLPKRTVVKGTPALSTQYSLPVRADRPVRTSKTTGRHVFLPEEAQTKPFPDDVKEGEEREEGEEEDEEAGDEEDREEITVEEREEMEDRVDELRGDLATYPSQRRHPSVGEGLKKPPKGRRAKRKAEDYETYERMSPAERADTSLPRLTGYAVAQGLHFPSLLAFLRREHGVRPRLYDEACLALYYKPLLPGFAPGINVRSSPEKGERSPGGGSAVDRQLEEREERGYEGSYFAQPENEHENHIDEHGYIDGLLIGSPTSAPEDSPAGGRQRRIKGGAQVGERDEHADGEGASEGTLVVSPDEAPAKRPVPLSTKIAINEALQIGEVVFFDYGVVVFYNFTESEEHDILDDLSIAGALKRPLHPDDVEVEQLHFCYEPSLTAPRIRNDFLTFTTPNHLFKLSLAHAIAQSAKLSVFEERMQKTLEMTSGIPKELALTGELKFSRKEALMLTGRLFKLRVDVNLVSNVLDVPELFWDEASLYRLYDAIKDYLEIGSRVEVLNERLGVASDLLEMIHEDINNKGMTKITWTIIWLIVIACLVAVGEITARIIFHTVRQKDEATLLE